MDIPIVDKKDKVIGSKDRTLITKQDIYRVASAWLITNDGLVLIQQRSRNKKNLPDKWGCSVAGTVETDESYDTNIVRETEEELGLRNINLQKTVKTFVEEDNRRFFCQWYIGVIKKAKIKFQTDEIETVLWIPIKELIKDINDNPKKYIPKLKEHLAVLLEYLGQTILNNT